jgi:Domain of unknown function (DUF4157)
MIKFQGLAKGDTADTAPLAVRHGAGEPLPAAVRADLEPRFGRDFSAVRTHTDGDAARAALAAGAQAYTVGRDVVFGEGRFQPGLADGRALLAHELAHVVQQQGQGSAGPAAGAGAEAEADHVASLVAGGAMAPSVAQRAPQAMQRKVEMRDVGKGEQSGFARLQELVDRLNQMAAGGTFSMEGKELAYKATEGATPTAFEQQMINFIGLPQVLPLRLTNRNGLLGTKSTGFNNRVAADHWESGYVDIDDLLASSDAGMQLMLVHFMTERAVTKQYAQRIGSTLHDSNADGTTSAEFQGAHDKGLDAETALLRAFFGDPTIRMVRHDDSDTVARAFRNKRGDLFIARMKLGTGKQAGVDALSLQVRTKDGKLHTPEEYKAILDAERTAATPSPAPEGMK